jgi:hypothetical protein
MSTEFFIILPDGQKQSIGKRFAGGPGKGVQFGFTPLNQNLGRKDILQPGEKGYSKFMLQLHLATLSPDQTIVDEGNHSITWQDLVLNLLFKAYELSDIFFGATKT